MKSFIQSMKTTVNDSKISDPRADWTRQQSMISRRPEREYSCVCPNAHVDTVWSPFLYQSN